jgi:N-acetylmuramic acid 6-phosphate etherase
MGTERRNPRTVDIDLFPTERILRLINAEDGTVAAAVGLAIPQITKAVDLIVDAIRSGGRVFYVGAGTSGRIAILDAVECPPTFNMPLDWIQAIIAGGSRAVTQGIENAEDQSDKAATDLKAKKLSGKDVVIGIAASGTTPYTHAALDYAREKGAKTVAIVCVLDAPMARAAELTICTDVGPEVITGSTRMKAGTAQKLVLNMISTAAMIRLGMTYSNWMINVSMTNSKLQERGIQILREILGVTQEEARRLADASGGKLKAAVVMGTLGCSLMEAERLLDEGRGNLRKILGHMTSGRE